eukprot:241654-Chlamydomonas_euryale.AAC.1
MPQTPWLCLCPPTPTPAHTHTDLCPSCRPMPPRSRTPTPTQALFERTVSEACAARDMPRAAGPRLDATFFGKPNPQPYRMAEALLTQQAAQLSLVDPRVTGGAGGGGGGGANGERSGGGDRTAAVGRLPLSGIYAVGDNPAADVRGANAAGSPWVSVLVQTGAGWRRRCA